MLRDMFNACRDIFWLKRHGHKEQLFIISEVQLRGLKHDVVYYREDAKRHYAAVLDIIAGKSPCELCEDRDECEENKPGGCSGWMLEWPKEGGQDA